MHVTRKAGTKEHAIKEWLHLLSLDQAECIGLGDSPNDLPLFGAVGLKVAVSNASADLKAQADYIAPKIKNGTR